MPVVSRLRGVLVLGLSSALLLTACAGAPEMSPPVRAERHDAAPSFTVEARFAVSAGSERRERHSGRLFWQHTPDADLMRVMTPLGQVVAEISSGPGFARLQMADRQKIEAEDATSLLQRVLGVRLPVHRMSDWMLARPRESSRIERDASGRVRVMQEEAWRIRYEYREASANTDPSQPSENLTGDLPIFLIAEEEGGPELRLRIEDWELPDMERNKAP